MRQQEVTAMPVHSMGLMARFPQHQPLNRLKKKTPAVEYKYYLANITGMCKPQIVHLYCYPDTRVLNFFAEFGTLSGIWRVPKKLAKSDTPELDTDTRVHVTFICHVGF